MDLTDTDSRPDTLAHITRVQELLEICCEKLDVRAADHDLSKLAEPEKSAFDRLKALSLSGMAYGSEEYRACLRAEKPAIEHHYKANSHHPEYYGENGVDGMSLFDVLEMLIDWKAATERMKDGGDIHRSLEINTERFKISPQLASILANTIREMQWPKPNTVIEKFMANVVDEFAKMHRVAEAEPEPDYDAPKPLTAQENYEKNHRTKVP